MSAAQAIVSFATWIALALSAVAFLLTVWRVVKGPTLPDRVVALDMLVGIVIGFIALIAIRTGFTLYIDIAIALGLVGFLATIAFARFILANAGRPGAAQPHAPGETDAGKPSAGAPITAESKKLKRVRKRREKAVEKPDDAAAKRPAKTGSAAAKSRRPAKPGKGA